MPYMALGSAETIQKIISPTFTVVDMKSRLSLPLNFLFLLLVLAGPE
jgi:hypothetical protein